MHKAPGLSCSLQSLALFVLAIIYLYPARILDARPSDARQANGPGQVLRAEKSSYVAGETITVHGSGFYPFETVTLQVLHWDCSVEPNMGHESWSVVAGGGGSFTAGWAIHSGDPGGREFLFTANGSSGSKAQAAFARVGMVVATDKSQYEPGETAQVKGAGIEP
jgi:hypothetical protein